MKLLLDFLPLILFVLTYKLAGVYAATAVLMASTVAQMAYVYFTEKKLSVMQIATLALILIFGALTLVLHNDAFIKWKFTVLHGAMGVVLAGGLWIFRKNLLKVLLGAQVDLPEHAWYRLCIAWIAYFLFMAALNAYVATAFNTNIWMNFKIASIGLLVAFAIGQGIYMAKHWKKEPPGLS